MTPEEFKKKFDQLVQGWYEHYRHISTEYPESAEAMQESAGKVYQQVLDVLGGELRRLRRQAGETGIYQAEKEVS